MENQQETQGRSLSPLGRPTEKEQVSGDEFEDLKSLSRRLSLSPRTIRTHVHSVTNTLPAYRVGGKFLFARADVDEWMSRRRVTVAIDVGKVVNELLADLEGDENAAS